METLNVTTSTISSIKPELSPVEVLFVATLSVLIAIANCLMGCELDLNIVLSTVKKPIAPAIGFFTQFILMPLIAYIVANIFLIPRDLYPFALGLFVSGCSPAGGASNFWTLLLDGNVHLSITMTFISMIASIFMIPFWMRTLGYRFMHNGEDFTNVKVPYRNIVTSLFLLIVPLIIGVVIARLKPNIASKARKTLRPFVIFVLVFVISCGTIANWHIFKSISWPAVVSGFLLPFGGFAFGCITSILLKQKPRDVAAISIETGVQNTGIAIMILKLSFPNADLSIIIPVIVACSTPFPLLMTYFVHSGIKRLKNSQSAVDIEKDATTPSFNMSSNSQKSTSQITLIDKNTQNKPLIKESEMTEKEKVEFIENVLDQVLTPGMVPDLNKV